MHLPRAPLFALLALLAVLFIASCGGGGSNLQSGAILQPITTADGAALPAAIDPEKTNPTAITAITGLQPGQIIEAMLFTPTGEAMYPAPIMLTAGQNGTIPLTVFYDLGIDQELNPDGSPANPATFGKMKQLPAGAYRLLVTSDGQTITEGTFTVGAAGFTRQYGADPRIDVMVGTDYTFAMGSVKVNTPVYVWGRNMVQGDKYVFYVVKDQQAWSPGDAIVDVTGRNAADMVVTVGAGGTVSLSDPRAKVWAACAEKDGERNFDVIAKKIAGNTPPTTPTFAAGDLITATAIPGFTVQDERAITNGQHRAFQVVCTEQGEFTPDFKEGDTLSVWVNPPWRITEVFWRMVGKYVVVHKATWNQDDPLVDASGRPEWDLVRISCSNEAHHPLWYGVKAGIYDIVVDVNGNGKYDIGIDILDQGPDGQGGAKVAGNKGIVLTVGSDKGLLASGETADVTAELRLVDGNAKPITSSPLEGVTVEFKKISGSATLSATSAVTGADGKTTPVTVTPTARGATVIIEATAKYEVDGKMQTATARCNLTTKAAGDLNMTIR
jgi:hypothetical protein